MAAGPLPEIARLDAPAAWLRVDFISDLHLSATTPRSVEAWAAYLHSTLADAVFILGDLFDVWIGDDTRDQPFEQHCVDVLRTASASRSVYFMAGNRDFLVGPALLADCGMQRLQDPTVLQAFGQTWLLSHGDALCLADVDYQAFRRLVRSAGWQQDFLARPVAERATQARAIRQESQARKGSGIPMADWADVDTSEARRWLQAAHCTDLIHGHTHRPGRVDLGVGCVRHVLSDWDTDHAPQRAEVLCLDAGGLRRIDLLHPS